MKRLFKKNTALYLLTFANIVYAVKHGFNWLTYVAIGLTGITIVLEIFDSKDK